MTWKDFKVMNSTWDYDNRVRSSRKLIQKNISIWEKRSTDICEYYLNHSKIKINNIKYDPCLASSKKHLKNHLIFMLDASCKILILYLILFIK